MADSLYTKIAEIAAGLHRFAKTERVDGKAGYRFTDVNAMADEIRPAMAERGIVMFPQAVDVVECREYVRQKNGRDGAYESVQWRTVLRVTWCVTDGTERITLESVGEALDTSDKSANKAQTASRKYAMIGLLNITTGDEPDPDYSRPGDGEAYAPRKAAGVAARSDGSPSAPGGQSPHPAPERGVATSPAPPAASSPTQAQSDELQAIYERLYAVNKDEDWAARADKWAQKQFGSLELNHDQVEALLHKLRQQVEAVEKAAA